MYKSVKISRLYLVPLLHSLFIVLGFFISPRGELDIDFSVIQRSFTIVVLFILTAGAISFRRTDRVNEEYNSSFKTVIDNIPVAVYAFDDKGKVIVWNHAAESITGFNIDEIRRLEGSIQSVVPEESSLSSRLNLNDSDVSGTFKFITKEKFFKAIKLTNLTKNYPVPFFKGGWGMGLDVTQQLKFEEESLLYEQKIKQSHALGNYGYWEYDITTGIIEWSDQTYKQFQFDENKSAPNFEEYLEVLHPDDRHLLILCISRAINKAESYKLEIRHFWKNGELRYKETIGTPIILDGKVVKLFGISADITQRKSDELARISIDEQKLRFQKVELELVTLKKNNFDRFLKILLRKISHEICVEKIGYWKFSDDGETLTEVTSYVRSLQKFSKSGAILKKESGLSFWDLLSSQKCIVLNQAIGDKAVYAMQNHLSTQEIKLNILCTVWFKGNMHGILRVDHYNTERSWSQPELNLISAASGFLSNALNEIDETRVNKELSLMNIKLKNLTIHLDEVREEEQKRIASEIHDQLGQELTAIKLELHYLAALLHEDQKDQGNNILNQSLDYINDLTKEMSFSIKKITHELRPVMLEKLGLVASIHWQIERILKNKNINVQLHSNIEELKLNDKFAVTIYRIIQESFNNIVKHSDSSDVKVYIYHQFSDELVVKIEDNGKGMPVMYNNEDSGFGLLGMKERTERWEGSMNIMSNKLCGTTLEFIFPLQKILKTKNTDDKYYTM